MTTEKNIKHFITDAEVRRYQYVLMGAEGSGKTTFIIENGDIFNNENTFIFSPYSPLFEKYFFKSKNVKMVSFISNSIKNKYLEHFSTIIIDDIDYFGLDVLTFFHKIVKNKNKNLIICARNEAELEKMGFSYDKDSKIELNVRKNYESKLTIYNLVNIKNWYSVMHKEKWFNGMLEGFS